MTASSTTTTPTEFIRFAEELADASRALIRTRFRRNADVEMKPDNTPVTTTDLEVETLIRNMIADRYPMHGVIGEEHPASAASADHVWVIDPIDGTRSFIAGRPVFGTLIALTVDAVPVLGVVDIPITEERWVGAKGHATLLNGKVASTRECPTAAGAILLATSPEYLDGDAALPFGNVAEAARFTIYDAGTQAYGLVASGHADIMIAARYGIVDYLAAVPVIEGAGGVMRDWNGAPLTLHSGDRFVAVGDAALLPETLQLLGRAETKGLAHVERA
ncbi:histidinol phosphatase-like enzyme (inositol monophosphatase family) [Pseudaminobacter salicylatoxidans]|uniref:Histidinol phosphatase-like enzyme (Inositol monophosphatase family) n=1 Tax=Pseudaminobacter salicylatoxidans TaxID=93369 RepID=A0A316C9F0_PSESE|nr:inositol monophosphatase family protein [Pseudaminobacter salicylatoxidans]PWJ84657.1 histidinol phosphatase-like enzyme (inositol monophosphatase family) [Pseudaminobacter salicylatoxidans]